MYHEYGHYINHHSPDTLVLTEKTFAKYSGKTRMEIPNKNRILMWEGHYRPIKDELEADCVAAEHTSPKAGLEFCKGIIEYEKLDINNYKLNQNIRRKSTDTNNWYYTTKRRNNDIFSRYEFFKKWVETGVKPRTNFE